MKLTTDYVLSLQQQIRDERDRKDAELEKLRQDAADAFLDHHQPNVDHIKSMLVTAMEKNPDATEYKIHLLTMGTEELSTFHPSILHASIYLRNAYRTRFSVWFHRNVPAAYLTFETLGNEKYIEVYLIFSLANA